MAIDQVHVSGARGESFADVARRVGTFAGEVVPPDATDAEVLALLVDAFTEIATAAGMSVVDPVRLATTANHGLAGLAAIDGVVPVAGNRVLVKNQAAPADNGIYVAAAGAWARAADFDTTPEVLQGTYVLVTEGATQTASAWVLTTPNPVNVGVTAQTWRLFRDMSAYVTRAGAETVSNKTFSGGFHMLTDGGRFGITNLNAPLAQVEGVVHIENDDIAGVGAAIGLHVVSKWQGSTGAPYTNNDNTLFVVYNDILSSSLNLSWSISANNAYNKIPAGVVDSGVRVGVLGWATSVGVPGYQHAGTLDQQYGIQGAAGFQGAGSAATAVITQAVGVRGLIYADTPGATIVTAQGGVFASDGLGLDGLIGSASTIQNNYGVYSRAKNGTVSNYAFYGDGGTFYNLGKMVCDDQIQANSTYTEGGGESLAASVVGLAIRTGYPGAGYGLTLGCTASSGWPIIGFSCEPDPAGNTVRTRGFKGATIRGDLGGALVFGRAPLANAAGQALVESARFTADGHFWPGGDNTKNLGDAAARFATVYAGTGAINTSDERLKKSIGDIPDEWLDAWGEVEWSRFKFKGGKRWHTGLVAQRVHDAFAKRGLDAFEIGLCCFDEWEAVTEAVTETVMRTRQVVKPKLVGKRHEEKIVHELVDEQYPEMVDTGETAVRIAAGDVWGLRYDECFAMEAAWTRRELRRLAQLTDKGAKK